MNKEIKEGTIRLGKDLKSYIWKKGWKITSKKFPEASEVASLFKAHSKLNILIDKKDSRFLKGQLSPQGISQGARINILPDGKVLDKAYSLFSKELTIHDESSDSHWDVLYKNAGGTYSYVYTLEKKQKAAKEKYGKVEQFKQIYPKLQKQVLSALKDKDDIMSLPMYTLLKTYMRVGNEIYYKAHKHKGLTTLKKEDIRIKGNKVEFDYIAKDSVPMKIIQEFPQIYIKRLQQKLKPLNNSSFVFTNPTTGHPLQDTHFKEAFKRYCGKEFYPHIVRSYFATTKAKEFLKEHKNATKEEINELFSSIAETLGHKRFVKDEHIWKDNFNTAIHNYIQPDVVERIKTLEK